MYEFDARYDEEGAAQAERTFYVRSVMELRRLMTFGPPLFSAVVVAAALALHAPWWFTIFFSAFLAVSIAGPVFFYFTRPAAAKHMARKCPVRKVALTENVVEITAGDQKAVVAWKRINHVWEAGDYLLLVLDKYVCISIPRSSLPHGANEFILTSIKSAV